MDQDTLLAKDFAEFVAWRKKDAGTAQTMTQVHGPGGLMSVPGMRPGVINRIAMPRLFADTLPVRVSVFTNEIFTVLTSQTAASGSNPTNGCDNCKTPGELKSCTFTYPFGRFCMDSHVLQVDNLGQLVNRGEFVDQTLVGDPFSAGALQPAGLAVNVAASLKSEKAKLLTQMLIDWKRTWAPITWSGNPTNNTNGYKEFIGIQTIVNTGKRDALSGALCPAADSKVVDFASQNLNINAAAFIPVLVELFADRDMLATRLGLGPVSWQFVMRQSAFRAITEIWPCAYYSYRCSMVGSDTTQTIMANDQVALRDDMRRRQYLLIDGLEIPVVVDDAIPETVTGGRGTSDIYLMAMSSSAFASISPGGAIWYWETFDMKQPVSIMNEGLGQYPMNTFQAVGGGRYLLYPKNPSNTCIAYGMIEKPRLVCEAPFLNGRVTNVTYDIRTHEVGWDPNDSTYFVGGGSSSQPVPYFYPTL